MRIEKWKYANVKSDGALKQGGNVNTEFLVKDSINDRCVIEGCRCEKCCWISINLGIQKNDCVYGITYYFESEKDKRKFILLN